MALTTTQISQLYVAIFNRASEGEGNAYWAAQNKTAAQIADDMLNTTDAATYFGSSLDSNQAFIEHVYLNTLNKTVAQDPDGIAYWVSQLAGGASRGEVVASLVTAIDSYSPTGSNYDPTDLPTVRAYNQFANRVEVSNYMADRVGNTPTDYATSTSFGHSLIVTDDASTVNSAKTSVVALVFEDDDNTIDLTPEMLEGRTFYTYDTDLEDSNFSQGSDALHKLVFSNGECLDERYTAPYGTSDWVLGETETRPFTITNGQGVNVGSDAEETWSGTLSLLSSTQTELVWWDSGTSTYTQGTATTDDDTTETWDNIMVWMTTQPSARTQAQIEALGVVVNTDTTVPSYNIHFNDASNISITSIEDGTAILQGGEYRTSMRFYENTQTNLGVSAQATITQTQLSISDYAGNTGEYSSYIYLGTTGDDIMTAANPYDALFGFAGLDTFIVKASGAGTTTIAGYNEGEKITLLEGNTLHIWDTAVEGWTITDGIAVKNEISTASDVATEFFTAFQSLETRPMDAVVAFNAYGKIYVYGSTEENFALRVTGVTDLDLHVDGQELYFASDDSSIENTLMLAQSLKTDDEDDLFFTFNDHVYIVKNDLKTWQQASDDASTYVLQNGKIGHLVKIDSAEENASIFARALELGTHAIAQDGGGASYIWTGGNDLQSEGNWEWSDGTIIASYTNWGSKNGWSEPDNYGYSGQDALGMALTSWPYGDAGEWNDINENNEMPYIIEIA